jgi:hypothetical protein
VVSRCVRVSQSRSIAASESLPPLSALRRWLDRTQVLPGSHKAEFMRPPEMFGEYGLAARQRSRESAGSGKGDLVRDRRPDRHPHADQPLPGSFERMGLRQITMQPGDISKKCLRFCACMSTLCKHAT